MIFSNNKENWSLVTCQEFGGTSVLLGLGSDGIGIERSLTICNASPFSPCSVLVRLYATMGLHCYNLLQASQVVLTCSFLLYH